MVSAQRIDAGDLQPGDVIEVIGAGRQVVIALHAKDDGYVSIRTDRTELQARPHDRLTVRRSPATEVVGPLPQPVDETTAPARVLSTTALTDRFAAHLRTMPGVRVEATGSGFEIHDADGTRLSLVIDTVTAPE